VEVPPTDRKYLVAMGRLTHQKGFDMLLEAFARSASCRSFDLLVVGEGQDRLSLSRQASELGLSGRVHFVGQVANAWPYLKGASLFVLSSRYEGFPNALLEAMAMGLPAVAFDCPSGVREIVRHNIDGLLVAPDQVAAMSRAIDDLLTNEENRRKMGLAAREVSQRFALARVLDNWEKAILRVSPTARLQPVVAGVDPTREIDQGHGS
jgi:glycosyltransferase involved in cell wall biosynthesis